VISLYFLVSWGVYAGLLDDPDLKWYMRLWLAPTWPIWIGMEIGERMAAAKGSKDA
jgi:hypothetical protein